MKGPGDGSEIQIGATAPLCGRAARLPVEPVDQPDGACAARACRAFWPVHALRAPRSLPARTRRALQPRAPRARLALAGMVTVEYQVQPGADPPEEQVA